MSSHRGQREREGEGETGKEREGEDHVKLETKIRMMCSQSKEHTEDCDNCQRLRQGLELILSKP